MTVNNHIGSVEDIFLCHWGMLYIILLTNGDSFVNVDKLRFWCEYFCLQRLTLIISQLRTGNSFHFPLTNGCSWESVEVSESFRVSGTLNLRIHANALFIDLQGPDIGYPIFCIAGSGKHQDPRGSYGAHLDHVGPR